MKKVLTLTLCLALAFGLISAATAEAPKTIYVIVKVLGNQYWSVVEAGANKAAADFGCEVVVVGTSAESDIEGQITLLQNAVGADADGIVIAPLDRLAMQGPIADEYATGIPMVLIDSKVDGEDYDCALLTDNIEAGRMSARELMAKLRARGIDEETEYSIAIQAGSTGSQAINDRLVGFREVWDAEGPAAWTVLWDDIKINDGDISRAVGFCQDFLTTYPDLIAVFGPNNGSTVGFVTGLTEADRTDITMVGFDFSQDMEGMIRSGKFDVSTILQRQYNMGYDGVRIALELANGGAVEVKEIDTGVLIVTPENVDSELVQSIVNP